MNISESFVQQKKKTKYSYWTECYLKFVAVQLGHPVLRFNAKTLNWGLNKGDLLCYLFSRRSNREVDVNVWMFDNN